MNGSTDVKEWGLLSVIDDGTFRVKVQATGPGDETGPEALSPEEYVGVFPVEEPDVTGSWSVNPSDPVRLDVTLDQTGENLTGYAYAPDPNAIFVLDMGPGNGFLLAMKILPGITLANLAGTYKFINVWNDEAGEGRSAGKAIINGDGTGSFSHLDTTGEISTGQLGDITACPQIPNLFHATSVETGHGATVTLKHYFLLLPYAYLGFNFRTDGDFRFAGYSVGARLD